MSSPEPLTAAGAWLYRLLTRSPARVSLDAGKVRFERRSGRRDAEVSVSSIDAIAIDRSLLWARLTIRAAQGQKFTIAGLGRNKAERLALAIHEAAARNVAPLAEQLKRADRQGRGLLSGRRYLRHSALAEFLNEHQNAIGQCRSLCRLESEQLKAIVPLAYERLVPPAAAQALEAEREAANERFVCNSIEDVRAAADDLGLAQLTDEQAEAIATDEDVTLVLAGAGTGKTSVITGKVAHLVRNRGVTPAEILVLAFNRQAAREIDARLTGELRGASVSTFHAFGSRVIAEAGGRKPSVSRLAEDDLLLRRAIEDILTELLADPRQSDALTHFILYNRAPWRPAFDFSSEAEYDDYVRRYELRTLDGVRVKSFEELVIANFLAHNGLRHDYEAPYPVETATPEHRQYRPDFHLPDHELYIEHFALDEAGNPPPGWAGYADGVAWKRNIHRQHGTALIETFSWQHEQDTLLTTLREQLEQRGVRLQPVPPDVLIKRLRRQKLSWLSALLASFLNHVRGGDLDAAALRKRAGATGDRRRNQRFLDVFARVRRRYEAMLAEQREIDFHDMIHQAAQRLRGGDWKSPYRYVLVDEFQDISAGRLRLLQVLRGEGVAFFLVGDDWQSIYRFAGSDLRLVKHCGDYLGHVRQRALACTFRFADGILGPSTAFVQRNPEQTQRPLRSAGRSVDLGITLVFDRRPVAGLRRALQEIKAAATQERPSVLVLGRFNSSRDVLQRVSTGNALEVEFRTVHRAKGEEADYVVVLDLCDDPHGFPSRIEDDPLLELVLPAQSGDALPFAEERRLFYVALTRARSGAWLVTDPERPSPFVLELQREAGELRHSGARLAPPCPRCDEGRLVPSKSGKNLRCVNHPHCRFLAPRCPECATGYLLVANRRSAPVSCTNPDCDAVATTCPRCAMGVLVRVEGPHSSFMGCSAWSWSQPPCRYKRPSTQLR